MLSIFEGCLQNLNYDKATLFPFRSPLMTTSCDKSKQRLVAIVGPTAVGKTNLVLQIAGQLDAEIVNIDSMQIYR